MYSLPSTSSMREPDARRMNTGSAPTALKARTGLSTPPGRSSSARWKSRDDLPVFMEIATRTRKPLLYGISGWRDFVGSALSPDDHAGTFAGVFSLVEHNASVDDDCIDSNWILKRIGERRAVGDGRRIEDDQVRGQAGLDQPAIGEVQLTRREPRHLVH